MFQQQQGQRCRWSHSLVSSDHLFIFLHKHNHLLLNSWHARCRAQLLFVSTFLENNLMQTKTATPMSSSFRLPPWKASLCCDSLKQYQNKIGQGTNKNTVGMKSLKSLSASVSSSPPL